MDDLIKMVTDKVGISPEQAKHAVETVLAHLKDKLPGPLAGQLEGLVSGQTSLGDLTKSLGGLFGKS